MDDEEIIGLFFARSEQAIVELDRKHGKLCHQLANKILIDQQDAEECVNDAYLGTWNAIPPQRPNPLAAFVCKLVHNRAVSRLRANNAEKRGNAYMVALNEIENSVASPFRLEDEVEAGTLARLIEAFLNSLSVENRVIFLRRYWFSDTYAEIAQRMGLPEKTVSVRLTRIRKELRKYLAKQGVLV